MTTRRVLILAPILLILVLLQSYFWVPTYEQQTRGNPERLQEYITGSIGDASILNPILSADSASSSINDMVFEGLIDRDEQLRFRGRLATSWEVYEEAYFYVNESARIPGLKIAGPKELVAFLKDAKKNESLTPAALKESLDHISSISFIPPHKFVVTRQKEDPTAKDKKINVNVSVTAPASI